MIINIKIVFTNHQPNHSWQKESYTEELHKEGVVSSRGTPKYLILVIRMKGRISIFILYIYIYIYIYFLVFTIGERGVGGS